MELTCDGQKTASCEVPYVQNNVNDEHSNESNHPLITESNQSIVHNEKHIDQLSNKLAESLLDIRQSSKFETQTKYVSMNEQLEEIKEKRFKEQLLKTQSDLQRYSADLAPVHHNSPTLCKQDPPSENVHTSNVFTETTHPVNTVDSPMIDSVSLSLTKPMRNGKNLPKTQTDWNISDGLNMLDPSKHPSNEIDILTAMSGEPTPNSLPHVTDGISDGEVSSDDSNAGDDSPPDTRDFQNQISNIKTFTTPSTLVKKDQFFEKHQRIMTAKTDIQKKEMAEALLDITSNITNSSKLGDHHTQPTDSSQSVVEPPIWEIRESYAETLRQQEQKRRQRIESEKRFEQEYRERHLEELRQIELNGKVTPAFPLEEDDPETYPEQGLSSDDDEDEPADPGRNWGWSGSRSYSKLSGSESCDRRSSSRSLNNPSTTHASNASRLAEHERTLSPHSHRKMPLSKRHSNSSITSSSSQSSNLAPSTVIRGQGNGEPSNDSDSSSSTNSWNCRKQELSQHSPEHSPGHEATPKRKRRTGDYDTDDETDKLLHKSYSQDPQVNLSKETHQLANLAMKNKAKEVAVYDPDEPTVLIEGILFRAAYLGSTQLVSESSPSKAVRMMQAQEAVGRIKAPDGESQPSTDVDLFVSIEKVMVLNTNLQEIMMDHALRSISYIADIDSVLVIMAKRSVMTSSTDGSLSPAPKQHKLICHIFETDEAHLIAQSIGQAFQVAYMEFLKANGIDDPNLHMKDTSYEDILEQQEIMNDELETFTRKDKNKEVVVPKSKGEMLGVVIVESGWGSVLPTVVLANMSPTGPAARCGQLNIGDQIMSVNGISLVGLPLSTCQEHIKTVRAQTAVRLCVVSRPPVVEVLIRRPDKKYQLGFSVQNGVICSLLRGGIAERGGVRVGHRIIEINGQSVVAVSHEKIVHILSTSVGEIHMKTMPMAIFRLLTGQEVPQYI